MATCPLTTREAIKAALDVARTSRANWQIDEAAASATDVVEGLLHRSFRPVQATRQFTWPAPGAPASLWRLWLDANEVITIDTLTIAGTVIPPSEYVLAPPGGPPFTNLQANLSTLGSFGVGATWQQAATITGLFGFRNDERGAGTVATSAGGADETVTVSNGAAVGVGDLIRVGTERMIVTDRAWADSGATTTTSLTASAAERAIPVSDGTAFHVGELALIDSEVVWITDIVANTLTVRRTWDGSALAAHSGSTSIWVSRVLSVDRGALGTTAAAHAPAAQIYRHTPPPLIERLARAETLVMLGAELAGYQGTTGAGETAGTTSADTIEDLRCKTARRFARHNRFRSVP